jgi:transposase
MLETMSVEEISHEQLMGLIRRVEHAIEHDLSLSVEDMKLLLMAITTLCTLQQKLENNDVTLHKLRKLLGMVQQSEQRRSQKGPSKPRGNKKSSKEKPKKKKPRPVAVAYHKLEKYQSGMACPDCHCGRLYKYDPRKLLRVTGHAPYEATQHITEQLRCNACQGLQAASLPAEVLADGEANQQYGYSARALMVIHKFYSGIPYHHQGNLADTLGHSVSASTIFDQCEQVANDVMPLFHELKLQAACAECFQLDDTHNRILEQQPEYREKRNGKGTQLRTGIYSSGLIALTAQGHEIVLFETSLGHTGELLDEVLKHRPLELPPPLTMSDALSSNKPTVRQVESALCNSHCRRQFVDIENRHPKEIAWVLETYSTIWKAEQVVKEKNLDPKQRLAYHQEHSLPAMESLRQWALEKEQSPSFEEHGAMGKAIRYLLRHYDRLTLFCVKEGALIDNNRMEETLKIIIRGRKTSHFYKTKTGADIANVLLSIIATAYRAHVNLFEYLIILQRHREHVRKNPAAWLPWCYQQTLEAIEKNKPPAKGF